MSEADQKPAALAVRGDGEDCRRATRTTASARARPTSLVDFIVSKEVEQPVELSGYAGYEIRGQPDGFDLPSGAFRWGVGAGFPSREPAAPRRAN